MKNLLYPVFGLIVLGSYTWVLWRGVDPGAASADVRALPPEARAQGPGGAARAGPAFWFVGGGFGGGK